MPKHREGPTKSKQTKYYYFDQWIGFPPNKKRVRFSLGTKDLAKAQWLWEQEYKRLWSEYYGLQPHKKPIPMRFVDLCREFVAYERDIKKIKEWKTVKNRLQKVADLWGNVFIESICTNQLVELDSHLRHMKPPRSPKTINDYMGILKTMFYYAIRKKYYHGDNPVSEIKSYTVNRKRREYSSEEIIRILGAADEVEKEAMPHSILQKYIKRIILLLLYTGRRSGEIINLRWESVKKDRVVLKHTETKQRKEEVIPLTRGLEEILEGLRKEGSEYVIPRRYNRKIISSMSTKTALKKMREKSRVEDFDLHSLRHTAASRLIASGVDIVTVKELLGHSSIKTTEIYAHGSFERKKKAIELLGEKAISGQD